VVGGRWSVGPVVGGPGGRWARWSVGPVVGGPGGRWARWLVGPVVGGPGGWWARWSVDRTQKPPAWTVQAGGWVVLLAECFNLVCRSMHRDRDIFATGRGASAQFAIPALYTGGIVGTNNFARCGIFTGF